MLIILVMINIIRGCRIWISFWPWFHHHHGQPRPWEISWLLPWTEVYSSGWAYTNICRFVLWMLRIDVDKSVWSTQMANHPPTFRRVCLSKWDLIVHHRHCLGPTLLPPNLTDEEPVRRRSFAQFPLFEAWHFLLSPICKYSKLFSYLFPGVTQHQLHEKKFKKTRATNDEETLSTINLTSNKIHCPPSRPTLNVK